MTSEIASLARQVQPASSPVRRWPTSKKSLALSSTPGRQRYNRAVSCSPCFVHKLRRPIGHDATTHRVSLTCFWLALDRAESHTLGLIAQPKARPGDTLCMQNVRRAFAASRPSADCRFLPVTGMS